MALLVVCVLTGCEVHEWRAYVLDGATAEAGRGGTGWCSERAAWEPGSPSTWPEQACTPPAPPDGGVPTPAPAPAAELRVAAGCGDALREGRERLTREMERALAENLQQALAIHCQRCVAYPARQCDGGTGGVYQDAGVYQPQPSGPTQYSETNNQVPGVDEADFVKTDGAYIYVVADGRFDILAAWPPSEAHRVASMPIDGTPRKLYVANDRALIYSSLGAGNARPCTYGYDCEFAGDGSSLKITIFDIADRAAPVLVRETTFAGSYVNSRRIGSIVHTVVVYGELALPRLETWPADLAGSVPECGVDSPPRRGPAEIQQMFADLHARNLALIDDIALTIDAGGFTDSRHLPGGTQTDTEMLRDCRNLFVSQVGDGQSLLALVSLDLAALEPLGMTTVLDRPGAVYASADALYVAVRHYGGSGHAGGGDWATAVHKFRLTPGSIATTYAGSGAVAGRVLNQFSMDEHDGVLRLATTLGYVPEPNVASTIVTLAEQDGALVVRGQVGGIGPGEDIRAARFSGDTAFVVTFKKTDPLFVIDVADPAAPVLRGELQIPGFSTYIHLMDPTHLLTIGFDADDQGSFAWFQGVMLQIFDVSDVARPQLLHKEVIGTRGTASDATTDHLAFNYFAPLELLALPMVICEGGSGGSFGSQLTFNGLLVYRATVADGFALLGGLPHNDGALASDYGCSQWWTSSQSDVKRSIFMDDYVYSIALDRIRAAALTDLAHPVVTLTP